VSVIGSTQAGIEIKLSYQVHVQRHLLIHLSTSSGRVKKVGDLPLPAGEECMEKWLTRRVGPGVSQQGCHPLGDRAASA
jgi:hypothetical protein